MGDIDEADFYSSGPAEGYSVCGDCFGEDELKAFIDSHAESQICDFCERKSRSRPIAAPLDEVVEFIIVAINREYERAVEALGWESAEGGYQGSHWDSQELLTEVIGISLP